MAHSPLERFQRVALVIPFLHAGKHSLQHVIKIAKCQSLVQQVPHSQRIPVVRVVPLSSVTVTHNVAIEVSQIVAVVTIDYNE